VVASDRQAEAMVGEYADVLLQIIFSLFPDAFDTDMMSMPIGSFFGGLRSRRRTKRLMFVVALTIACAVFWWSSFGKISETLSQPS